jgi:hypothetical protein
MNRRSFLKSIGAGLVAARTTTMQRRVQLAGLVLLLATAALLGRITAETPLDAYVESATDGQQVRVIAHPGGGLYPVFTNAGMVPIGYGRLRQEVFVAWAFVLPPVYLPIALGGPTP